MTTATDILGKVISEALKNLYSLDAAPETIAFQQTKKEFEGDLTIVVFPYVKVSKKGPEQTAAEIGEYLKANCNQVEAYNVVKGFLNISLTQSFWIGYFNEIIALPNFGTTEAKADSPQVLLEYSSPNTNKPLHLGHIRNHLLGFSVAELLKATGNRVIKTSIINDRGVHICKSMLAWKESKLDETPEKSNIKGDHLVGKYYVEFDKWSKREVESLTNDLSSILSKVMLSNEEVDKDIHDFNIHNLVLRSQIKFEDKYLKQIEEKDKEKKDDSDKYFNSLLLDINIRLQEEGISSVAKEIFTAMKKLLSERIPQLPGFKVKEMLRKWEAGDKEVVDLWKMMNAWVYAGFDVTYKTLGVDFDKTYYESNTYILGKDMVAEGLQKGVFFKKDDGSVWIDLTNDGLDQKLVQRADGTSVYITQDIGTAALRYKEYPELTKMIYTVGNEQDYHFKVLFLILGKLGYAWAKECYHLSYGMVELPEGKMKSREGTVVDADDLMQEMYDTAEATTKELGKIDGFTDEEAKELYRNISLGALKYFILKVDPKKKMLFDPKESIDFNGHTGPFIQYTYARIQSILRKANFVNTSDTAASVAMQTKEKDLIKIMHEFPQAVTDAAKGYSPALLANYVYELAKVFNQFYHDITILKEENEELKIFRLNLAYKCGLVIKTSMKLLGINVPDRM
jgi:arginyl-tRNA synthetase